MSPTSGTTPIGPSVIQAPERTPESSARTRPALPLDPLLTLAVIGLGIKTGGAAGRPLLLGGLRHVLLLR